MSFCSLNCTPPTFIPGIGEGCDIKTRKGGIYKIGFFSCATSIPSPLTCSSLETLIESNAVVFSSPLADITVEDPTIETVTVADCLPVLEYVSTRVINFVDKIAITKPGTTDEVPIPPDPFYDYKFWGDKMKYKQTLGVMLLYCDGRIEIPRNENGGIMTCSLNVYRTLQRNGDGSTLAIYDIKQGSLTFKGDPLSFNDPDLIVDKNNADCADLAALLGL